MAESELHQQLKRLAFEWLWNAGYAAIADEVRVPSVGIVDVAAAGKRLRPNPRRVRFSRPVDVDRHHVVFAECKAFRGDFLRDQGQQQQFEFALKERQERLPSRRRRKRRALHASPALGKFDACLMRPFANLHYLVTPPGVVKADEVPRRWGLLVAQGSYLRVARRATWQESAHVAYIEGAIARALTAQRAQVSELPGANLMFAV